MGMWAYGRAKIRNRGQIVARHWQVEYACSGALTSGTRGKMRVNQFSPLNILFRIVACYEFLPAPKCARYTIEENISVSFIIFFP